MEVLFPQIATIVDGLNQEPVLNFYPLLPITPLLSLADVGQLPPVGELLRLSLRFSVQNLNIPLSRMTNLYNCATICFGKKIR